MTRLLPVLIVLGGFASAQMSHAPAAPSTTLTVTGLSGSSKVYTPAEFRALPHVTVNVHNTHSNKDESYSGVPVRDLLAAVAPAKGESPKVSANMTLVIASATDDFHVALTLCDTNPDCRNGESIVADAMDGAPLGKDGAFKLVLSEDKKPGRWARNLALLTVKAAN